MILVYWFRIVCDVSVLVNNISQYQHIGSGSIAIWGYMIPPYYLSKYCNTRLLVQDIHKHMYGLKIYRDGSAFVLDIMRTSGYVYNISQHYFIDSSYIGSVLVQVNCNTSGFVQHISHNKLVL